MGIHTFHLACTTPAVTARTLVRPPTRARVPGLEHAECMAAMELGSPLLSRDRIQPGRLAMFASWRDDAAIDRFLATDPVGVVLANGWHVRLEFLRRWGSLTELDDLPTRAGRWTPDEPVVAVTLARMRLPQLPRFLHWGRPVERQVRDHPATRLALAATRPPRTVCTFTVWESVREMVDMVNGRSPTIDPDRHRAAMQERDRHSFHHQFVTLRFRPRSEHGSWLGRSDIIPT